MTYNLTENQKEMIMSALKLMEYSNIKQSSKYVSFQSSEGKNFKISYTSRYLWHVTENGAGNTYGHWTNIRDMMLWIYDNKI